MTLTELFTNIANAIRAKTGSTEPIVAEDFPSAIEAIPVGSTVDLDAEVTEQETIASSQDALVGEIVAALEGKAAGGGAEFDTCTLEVYTAVGYEANFVVTTVNNGVIGYYEYIDDGNGGTIENVLCGSPIIFTPYDDDWGTLGRVFFDTEEFVFETLEGHYFITTVPNRKDETISVYITDDI